MQSLRSLRCLALLASVWLGLGSAPVRGATDEQIQASITRAVGYLKGAVTSQRGGHLSLMVLALLKAGVPADSPEVKAGLTAMAAQVASCASMRYLAIASICGLYPTGSAVPNAIRATPAS